MKSILLFYLASFVWSSNEVVLQDIKKSVQDGKVVIDYEFNQQVDARKVGVDYINQTLQFDLPNAYIEEKKRFTSIEDDKIKSLYTYQLSGNTLRMRIIYDNIESKSLDGKIQTAFIDNKMRISIDDGRVPMKALAQELPPKMKVPTIHVDDLLAGDDQYQQKQAETIAVVADAQENREPAEVKKEAAYDEASIPVFKAASSKTKEVKESKVSNIATAVAIFFLTVLGIFFIFRKWSVQKYKNPHTHIKVLTQHHLGPKKTLAIVSVAGESILIGITDTNINMIKSLSLLDEDVPEDSPKSFDSAFDQAQEKIENKEDGVEEDTFNVMGIKDVVKTRLQNMREL